MEEDPYRFLGLDDARLPLAVNLKKLPSRDTLHECVDRIGRSKELGGRLGWDWEPDKQNVIPQSKDDVWVSVEQLKPLNDMCTKFCTHTFFPKAIHRVSMIAHVVRVYEAFAKAFRLPFHISFKGGVMVRFLLLQFWTDKTLNARRRVVKYLKEKGIVGFGDFDFEIVLHEPLTEAERFRVLYMNTYVLDLIRTHLQEGLDGKHEDPLLNVVWVREEAREGLRQKLQEEVKTLPKEHPLHGASIDYVSFGGDRVDPPDGYVTQQGKPHPAPRRNLFVYQCKRGRCVSDMKAVYEAARLSLPSPDKREALYTSCNLFVGEDAPSERARASELRSLFHLSRIKHTFSMYYTTKSGQRRCDRLAGEIIDLSMGLPQDEAHHLVDQTVRESYRRYALFGVPSFRIPSFTPERFLADLRVMLHHSDVPPWKANKYSKRVGRYIALLFVHVFSPDERGGPKEEGMRLLLQYVKDPNRVLRGPMEPTGVGAVDAFAMREHQCAVEDGADAKEWKAYLRVVSDAISDLLRLFKCDDDTALSLDETHLEYGAHYLPQQHVSRPLWSQITSPSEPHGMSKDAVDEYCSMVGDFVRGVIKQHFQYGEYSKIMNDIVKVANKNYTSVHVRNKEIPLVLSYLDQMRNCVSDSMKMNLMHKGILTARASQKINNVSYVTADALYRLRCNSPVEHVQQRRQRLQQFFPILEQVMTKDVIRLIRHKLRLPKYWKVHEVRLANALNSSMSFTFSTEYSYDTEYKDHTDKHVDKYMSLPRHPFITIYEEDNKVRNEIASFVHASITVYAERSNQRFAFTIPVHLLSISIHNPLSPNYEVLEKFNTNFSLLTPLGILLLLSRKRHKNKEDEMGVFLAMSLEHEMPSRVWSEMKRHGIKLTPSMTRMAKQMNEAWKLSERVRFPRITYVTMYNVEDYFV